MIEAKVVAHSINTSIEDKSKKFGHPEIGTMVVTFPRIILAEFNTHRMFSRNSASSRAIPFEKMVKSVEDNPFIPIAWQKDHKGMQGTEYLTNKEDIEYREHLWLKARNNAVRTAKDLSDNQAYPHGTYNPDIKEGGITKQLCNRLLEPFMWHTVIVTATEWENFFALRCPQYLFEPEEKLFRSWKDLIKYHNECFAEENKDDHSTLFKLQQNKGQAEIHMMALAEAMWDAYNESTPKELKSGEWHIPFGGQYNIQSVLRTYNGQWHELTGEEQQKYLNETKVKIATARCARVSYTVVGEEDKKDNYENDIKLHDRLAASGHMSPFEHCAKAMSQEEYGGHIVGREARTTDKVDNKTSWLTFRNNFESSNVYIEGGWSGNFRGFVQYRKTIPNENIVKI